MTFLRHRRLHGIVLATVLSLSQAAGAVALEPLNEEKHINDSLRAGFIADRIDDECDTISARKFVALAKLNDLKSYALKKGYAAEEIRAFVRDKNEKKRGKAEAAAWLEAAGAVPGDAESYCRIGRDEIARKSLIGSLLRSSQ
jgi:hypothetical protein